METNTTNRAARIGFSQSALTTCRKKQNHGYNERRNPVILVSPMIRSLRFGSTKNSSPKTSKTSTNTNITKPEAKHTRIIRPSIIRMNSHEAAARQRNIQKQAEGSRAPQPRTGSSTQAG
uniref:Uncharacterized protein n=1 Tax=Brassica oleracea var. oleracea TaxID=109376 RepID=A0A0D3D7Q0_BRAOL